MEIAMQQIKISVWTVCQQLAAIPWITFANTDFFTAVIYVSTLPVVVYHVRLEALEAPFVWRGKMRIVYLFLQVLCFVTLGQTAETHNRLSLWWVIFGVVFCTMQRKITLGRFFRLWIVLWRPWIFFLSTLRMCARICDPDHVAKSFSKNGNSFVSHLPNWIQESQ